MEKVEEKKATKTVAAKAAPKTTAKIEKAVKTEKPVSEKAVKAEVAKVEEKVADVIEIAEIAEVVESEKPAEQPKKVKKHVIHVRKLTKRQKQNKEILNKISQPTEAKTALETVIKTASTKFDETIELHVRLGVDGTKAEQQVRGTVVLPAGTGKTLRVIVVAKGDNADIAKKNGADFIGDNDLIAKIAGGWVEFDVCITTPDMMPLLGRVAKVLGPKGLMPNPKSGTVTTDIAKALNDVKAGKVEYRLDKNNIVHTILGKKSFGVTKLLQNYEAVISALIKAKPSAAKGVYLKSVAVCSSMGPAVKIKANI